MKRLSNGSVPSSGPTQNTSSQGNTSGRVNVRINPLTNMSSNHQNRPTTSHHKTVKPMPRIPPPKPPPRRRRRPPTFYSSLTNLAIDDDEKTQPVAPLPSRPAPAKPPPPPVPQRSVSVDTILQKESNVTKVHQGTQYEETNICSLKRNEEIFSREELIKNLTENLKVIENLNESLRKRVIMLETENVLLIEELKATRMERAELVAKCHEIERLKENEWVCSICLDDRNMISRTRRQLISTSCGHIFCSDCFSSITRAEEQSSCPTCRKELKETCAAFHHLYF